MLPLSVRVSCKAICLIFLSVGCVLRSNGQTPEGANQKVDITTAILQRLDKLETENRELLDEVRQLREEVKRGKTNETAQAQAAAASPPANATDQPQATSSTPTEHDEIQDRRLEEVSQTKVEASQKFPVQLTGTLLFNAFLNGSANGGSQNPVVASLAPGSQDGGGSFRQTVLGLTFQSPRSLWGGAVSGSLYMDFFGGSGTSLDQLMRLRLATVQIDWPALTFVVGKDKPIVSLREPNSLAQVGVSPLTAAGNPWLWQPQARLEKRFTWAQRQSILATAGVFQTEEDRDAANVPIGSRPAFETRVAYRNQIDDDRAIEVGGVFHNSETHVAGQSIDSRLYGLDLFAKPFRKFEITGLIFRGQNFANLGALGGLTRETTGSYIPIRGSGGWLQLRYLATNKLSFDVYGGLQDDRDGDLASGAINRNVYLAANAMYLLAPNVTAAFEFGQARTTYLNLGTRLNPHYDLALAYTF
jgi:hypothetical protein